MPAMRGLLAPQNTFLDTIATRFDGTHSNFVLGNAQVAGLFPVVYCSDGFCDLTGFSRAEVMQRGCACSFLYGPDTSELVRQQIRKALDEHKEFKAELILYRKSGEGPPGRLALPLGSHLAWYPPHLQSLLSSPIFSISPSHPIFPLSLLLFVSSWLPFWCLLDVIPIKNEKGEVALFLVSHKDISDTKNRGGPDSWKERGGGRRRYGRAGAKGFNANRRRSRAVLYHLSGHLQKQPKGKHKLNKGVFGEKPNLPEYKVAAIRKSPFILLHCGALRATWDGFILLATLYVAVTVPYSVCVSTAREPSAARSPPSVCDLAVEVLFILGQVVFAPKSICLHYVTTWFLLDVIAALPFDLLHAFKVNVYVGAHLLKTVRLLRLLRLLPRLDRYSQYSAVVLTLLMAVFALLAHWVACIWFYIGQREIESSASELPEIGWLQELARRLETPYYLVARSPAVGNSSGQSDNCSSSGSEANRTGPELLGGPSLRSAYITSLYFALSSLTSVGFGNVSANTDTEKIFSICTMLIGALMHAVVFGNVTAIIQRMYARRFLYHSRTRDLRDYIRIHRIPKPLKQRMLEYFQATWAVNNGIDTTELLQSLPDELRADIAMHLHKEVLQLPLFEAASRGCLRALSLALRPAFCTPGEYLIHQGDALQALYFVCSGSMEVLKGGTVLAILGAGLADLCFLSPGKGDLIGCELPRREQVVKANADVKGLTYCVLQCLQLAGLHESLALYPEFAPRFSRGLRGELSYNLGAGGGPAEVDTSSLSGDNTLMSTLEEKETDGEQGPTASPAPADEPSSPLLSPSCTSSSSAAKLLSPRQTAPRPRLGGRGRPGRAGASQAEAGPSAHPRSLEGLRLPHVPWNVPPDLSPRVVDGIEDGCGSDQPKFSFRVRQSGPECSSSPSPGPENSLLTVPLGPREVRNTDTLDKLRQAVTELSEQVLQMREGLQSLRQAVQLVLAPHGEGPCPRAATSSYGSLALGPPSIAELPLASSHRFLDLHL
ncbi:Potassium voltage-gated channel subfamily H member 3 [Camelus dromedarius]|uniref:Voltage-gated inwardly rectifying potassium channel KCNH3 n=1 Tax=Camelus dromedarius TaxID=9838 RepID=A0A5N4DGR5_CAMDR|nr:Potassium voltage-gated channel subfamily H member 3 [Camelus dromedarius]